MIKIYASIKNKYKTTVIPSVSFFDYVIDAVIKEITNEIMYIIYTYPTNDIDTNKNCIILNPDILKNDIHRLINLAKKIPKKHPFYTIKINKNKIKGYEIKKFKFEKFVDTVKTLDNETTIFIPALKNNVKCN